MTDSLQQAVFPPPPAPHAAADHLPEPVVAQVQQPVRPSWNPAEEARRRAELEAAAAVPAERSSRRRRGREPEPPVDLTATAQIRAIAADMPVREERETGAHHMVMVPRVITLTGFFLFFAIPAIVLILNQQGHVPLMDGVFEPDEYAKRLLSVLVIGAVVCQLGGWLWWGVAASLNAQNVARWSVSPWYVPLTYLAVAAVAIVSRVVYGWLQQNPKYEDYAIIAPACAAGFAVIMYFSTLGTFRRSAQGIGDETKYWTRLIVWPWLMAIAGGVTAWFWAYLPTQAVLGTYVAVQLFQGLYGLWMYQAMTSFDRACTGTRQMRQDSQDFAKFFKPGI
ncbi:MAG: hypothetical protein ACOYMR_12855 [Ilumatobacteraceae bacterium]